MVTYFKNSMNIFQSWIQISEKYNQIRMKIMLNKRTRYCLTSKDNASCKYSEDNCHLSMILFWFFFFQHNVQRIAAKATSKMRLKLITPSWVVLLKKFVAVSFNILLGRLKIWVCPGSPGNLAGLSQTKHDQKK